MGLLLLIAMMVVYIILGILYESFIHPLTILSGLPSAAVGALLTLYIFGMPLSLYAFVGMIMLIGIVKKNAIMMIDFALHRQRDNAGVPPEQAIYEAAMIRFRPIMMTTMAAMMGTMPIALGMGAGADSRRPLGMCVAGGLLLSQLLTLYITPVIYVYLDRLGGHFQLFRKRPSAAQPRPLRPSEITLASIGDKPVSCADRAGRAVRSAILRDYPGIEVTPTGWGLRASKGPASTRPAM